MTNLPYDPKKLRKLQRDIEDAKRELHTFYKVTFGIAILLGATVAYAIECIDWSGHANGFNVFLSVVCILFWCFLIVVFPLFLVEKHDRRPWQELCRAKRRMEDFQDEMLGA